MPKSDSDWPQEDPSEEQLPDLTCDDPEFLAAIHGLSALEERVNSTSADTPKDHLADLRNCILVLQQRAAALRQKIDQAFIHTIEAHGPIEIGTTRYVVTVDRTIRCRDTTATAECVLDAAGGDFTKFCSMLVAQPFKPASVRAILPSDAYQGCFEVVERMKVEGQPLRRLKQIDTRFAP